MRICLDTNAYSAIMRGNGQIIDAVERAGIVIMPAVVLGELYAGFYQGRYLTKNLADLHTFLAKPGINIHNINQEVAIRYGTLIKQLKQQGTPIPTNDIWIASVALETGTHLLTLDNHFQNIPGISFALQIWEAPRS